MIVNNYRYSKYQYYNTVNFRGELETQFFRSVKNKNVPEQLKILKNIKFDVLETDKETGNNFFHVVCQNGSKDFWDKAIRLLKINREKVETVLNTTNNENKKPLEYSKDSNMKKTLNLLFGIATLPVLEKSQNNSDKTTQKVGNEVNDKIEISNNIFDDEEDDNTTGDFISTESIKTEPYNPTSNTSALKGIIGLNNAKEVFEDEILEPIKNNKNVFTNGFLLCGFSGNGKTYCIEQLADELGRNIIGVPYLLSYKFQENEGMKNAEDTNKVNGINDLIDKSVIKVNSDNISEISEVVELLKNHFKETGTQGFLFIDELQKLFPENDSYNVINTNAMQAIENSAKHGVVLLATTRDKTQINANLLNPLRFEKIIELSPPKENDIADFISQFLTVNLNTDDKNKLARSLTGFTYNDLSRIIGKVNNKTDISDYEQIKDIVKKYAKDNGMTDLSEKGTTYSYDTYLKRVIQDKNAPQRLEDVSGMDDVKEKLRKVFVPLKKGMLLEKYWKENKVKKPNGILLYGAPGCGKTYIMCALANEMKLPLYQVKISDIGSSYINQTEKNIKRVFDQLRKKYKETGEASILFFDECDSLFSDSKVSNQQAILNTLKEEMNNAGEDGVYVVAATNEKDNLNSAITRDGRLDIKIEVGYPDENARFALIKKLLSLPVFNSISKEENILELVKLTKNMSNATISTIFSNIGNEKGNEIIENVEPCDDLNEYNKRVDIYLARQPVSLNLIKDKIKLKREEQNNMKLKSKDKTCLEWQAKTANYDEFLDRVYYGENDPKSLKDVIGMEEVKEEMYLKVLGPLNPIIREDMIREKIPLAKGIILYGPGGVGKTYIVKATAAESKIPLYQIKISEVGTKYSNETANNLKKVFDQLKRKYKETSEPSILFLDESDSLLGKIDSVSSGADRDRINTLNTLKEEIGDASENGIVVIAATNEYENLDKNVIRSGRFDAKIQITYPDVKARTAYIKYILSLHEPTKNILLNEQNTDSLVKITDGMSNADIKTIIENAIQKKKAPIYINLINSMINKSSESYTVDSVKLSLDDIKKQIDEFKKSGSEE